MGNTVGRQFRISKSQSEVIIGSLLGDARLECRSKNGNARLRIHHGWKQKDLVFWKYEVLKNLVSCVPKKIVCWKNPKNGEDYFSWYFHTLTMKALREFYQIFYLGKQKRLPENIFEILTPRSLAVWIMDDGCHSKNSLILNTQSFSLDENRTLQEIFKRKFSLDPKINKDRDEWRLRFGKYDFPRIQNIVKEYIIPSMEYKIVPVETFSSEANALQAKGW